MRILLTNDDGIHAPGIEALYLALTDPRGDFGGPLAEVVWPVAPLTVQSATSHGVTFHTPLMVSEQTVSPSMSGLAVDGRPADCVKLAICSLWPERFGTGTRPDVVISGMNAGVNVGINVIYSGTVAAALEAAFLGVPAVAVSMHITPGHTRFDLGAAHARRVLERILRPASGFGKTAFPLAPHDCVNINIPNCSGDQGGATTPEVAVCPMNTHGLVDAYERRVSPGGDVYYWAAGSGSNFRGADGGTDVEQILRGRITVTPLKYDLTQPNRLDSWRQFFEKEAR